MKLTKLTFAYFSGAAWANLSVEIIALDKDECLKIALEETSDITLFGVDVTDLPTNRTSGNPYYEVFKINPEKYVQFWWEEVSLPLVTVREK